jgi:hypothetical protein
MPSGSSWTEVTNVCGEARDLHWKMTVHLFLCTFRRKKTIKCPYFLNSLCNFFYTVLLPVHFHLYIYCTFSLCLYTNTSPAVMCILHSSSLFGLQAKYVEGRSRDYLLFLSFDDCKT